MRGVGIEGVDYRRAFENQADPGVAMTVNPPLVTLGQAKPSLQIEIIPDRFIRLLADEEPGKEAEHHRGHTVADRILSRLESIDQRLECLLPLGDILRSRLQRRGHLRDHLDVFPDCLLLFFDFVQALLDASGQAAELLLREPPFFAPKFRRSDSWTSLRPSAIFKPAGCSGPP